MLSARLLPLALAGVLACTGCSGEADDDVAGVVTSFYATVGASDGAAACELLAPGTREELESSASAPCAEALLSEVEGATGEPEVTVSGSAAQVKVGSETVFLSRFDDGWLVTAAGCTPPAAHDRPYDCRVEGG